MVMGSIRNEKVAENEWKSEHIYGGNEPFIRTYKIVFLKRSPIYKFASNKNCFVP